MNVSELDFRMLTDHYQVVITRDRGGRATALCPFPSHKEKTPSFSIDYGKKVFHCFGCGQGGGIIKFVELMEDCSRDQALNILQDIYGVVLERGGKRMIPPPVAMEARYKYDLIVRLSTHYSWLRGALTYYTYEMLEEECYQRYFDGIRAQKEQRESPGPYLFMVLSGEVDGLLLKARETWIASWPPVMGKLRDAHFAGDEEGYFALWDEDVDRVVMERDLLTEVERLTMKKLERAECLMKSGNSKKLEKGKAVLTAWIGALRRLVSAGIYANRNLILKESFA